MRVLSCFALASLWMLGCSADADENADNAPAVSKPEAGASEAGPEAAADGPGCIAATCAGHNANCGQMPDGCGGVVDCGSCPVNQFCGADGPNRCGNEPCVPITCESASYECGSVSDGCSKVLSCGACAEPAVCGASGHANKCGCVPASCGNFECGLWSDNCGGTLHCGDCAAGKTCVEYTCCVSTVNSSCSLTCSKLVGPVRGYSQYEGVWCSHEGQSKVSVDNCSVADPDPCTTGGLPPDCGLVPGYSWCDVTCNQQYECLGTMRCDGSCS